MHTVLGQRHWKVINVQTINYRPVPLAVSLKHGNKGNLKTYMCMLFVDIKKFLRFLCKCLIIMAWIYHLTSFVYNLRKFYSNNMEINKYFFEDVFDSRWRATLTNTYTLSPTYNTHTHTHTHTHTPVSYTHLDVYKRQMLNYILMITITITENGPYIRTVQRLDRYRRLKW